MAAFYRDVIGLTPHSETRLANGLNRRFLCGATVVKLRSFDNPPPLGVPGAMTAYGLRKLNLFVPDFDALIGWIAGASGAAPDVRHGKARDGGGLRYLYTDDLEGNAGLDGPREGGATVQAGIACC
ncbi:MAG: hypothetical protein SGJ21_11395 [Alphaproteobacteria bacterium]|nr:hypothetical protein [Alphaproteobacteria bacterium]